MANPFDKILEEKELDYADLTPAEKRLYEQLATLKSSKKKGWF